jgi:hypothetical protein
MRHGTDGRLALAEELGEGCEGNSAGRTAPIRLDDLRAAPSDPRATFGSAREWQEWVDCRPSPLLLAAGTWARFADRATRLYEQEQQGPKGRSRLGAYVERWRAWAGGGLAAIGPDLMLFRVDAGGVGGLAGLPGT